MGVSYNSVISRDGLLLHLVAGNSRSYPGTGTTWYDLSGNNNHGTFINGPTYSTSNGGVLNFSGASTYVSIPQSLQRPSIVSVSTWISISDVAMFNTAALGFDTGSIDAYAIWLSTGNPQIISFALATGGLNTALSTISTINKNTFYHFVGTCGNDGVKIYLNGQLNNSSTFTTQLFYGNFGQQRLLIGSNGSTYASCQLDDIRVYNRALSPVEIRQIFNSTRRRFGV